MVLRAFIKSGFRQGTALAALAVAVGILAAASDAPRPAAARVETGRISGTVILSHALASRRPRFRIYSDVGRGSTPPSQSAPDLKDEYANVVLYLETDRARALIGGDVAQPSKPAIVQKDEKFIPHVLPILQGTTVDFPNQDDVFHNVFSLSGPKTFDLPKYPSGSSRSVTFDKAGVVHVFCHIHSDMSAIILVRDNPYFTAPDTTGSFTIDNIPPGEYTLVAWHERINAVTQKVRIVAGQTARPIFNIPLPQPADR